ncbi:MAG: UDP-glucose 4-epimerase GalE, partial [Firmicutes bacterium]|nr:UDP-glucose 4-epimerase GalE [Bacillota bacterium]
MAILVTGGTGYIGSHTVIELIKAGYEPVIVDNLINSKIEVLERLKQITGKPIKFYQADCCDKEALRKVFLKEKITAVIHFAGLKAVGESVEQPLKYYYNNLNSTIALLEVMKDFKVNNFVFSSSATVYGTPKRVPLYETDPIGGATNPYGSTKIIIEGILQDVYKIKKNMNIAILRYFNPIGAHESGLIGEDPSGLPNNLMPYITQVAVGRVAVLPLYGNDYDTIDGTGVRDYIHVVDLAKGHIAALKKLDTKPGLVIYNLGTGRGTSVLELIHAFEEANKVRIPYEIKERRPGDIASSYANCDKALKELNWKAELTIKDACR